MSHLSHIKVAISNIQVDKETVSGKCLGRYCIKYPNCFYCSSPLSFTANSACWTYLVRSPSLLRILVFLNPTSCEVAPYLSSLAFIVLRLLCLLQSPDYLKLELAPFLTLHLLHQKHLEFTSLVERVGLSALLCSHMMPNLRSKQLWHTSFDLFLGSHRSCFLRLDYRTKGVWI